MRVDNFNEKYHQLKRMMKKISGSPLCNVSSDNEALLLLLLVPPPRQEHVRPRLMINSCLIGCRSQNVKQYPTSYLTVGGAAGGGIIRGSCMEYSLLCEELLRGWKLGSGCGVE